MRWALVFLLACAHGSVTDHAAKRTAELRALDPPGKATRTEVEARWGRPEVSLVRPDIGWKHPFVLEVENRTGAFIARAEKFIGPEGTSAGVTLAHVWYFFDRFDVVVDVIYERMGD